jgi:predicted transport protein
MGNGDATNGDGVIAKEIAGIVCSYLQITSDNVCAYVEAGIAPATRRAYKADLEHFRAWGGDVPTTDVQLAAYLAEHATTLKVATLTRRLAAISIAHKVHRLPSPVSSPLVRATMRGVRREHGTAQRQATPLLRGDLFFVLGAMGDRLKDLYNFRSRSYWLRRLENHGRKERVPVDEYTIEHILPQNFDLSAAWRHALSADWQRVQKDWLHTLGNLTLTGYNAEYSDRPFAEKRDMEGGFKQSPLKLNAGLGQLDVWDEPAIQHRAGQLANQALAVWAAPTLDAATLTAYQPTKQPVIAGYTIEFHPNLLAPGLRELFEAFRKEVLALDPCVSEEFKKLYVAYKAETNFVDVVPLAKRLRLTINMTFPEISDPKGLCRDVTNLGRWGNGDVEVGLTSLEELPYVMGLVRQSYERQMGDGVQL